MDIIAFSLGKNVSKVYLLLGIFFRDLGDFFSNNLVTLIGAAGWDSGSLWADGVSMAGLWPS